MEYTDRYEEQKDKQIREEKDVKIIVLDLLENEIYFWECYLEDAKKAKSQGKISQRAKEKEMDIAQKAIGRHKEAEKWITGNLCKKGKDYLII